MKRITVVLLSLLVIASMLLSACQPAPTPAPEQAKPEEAMPEEAKPEEAKPAETKLAVGIVLPTKDEPRWIQDETRFKDALKEAGYDVEILFSQGSSAKEKENVEALITKGVKVMIICPQDGTAAAASAEEARKAGVKVISYDRLIRDTEAVDYYVTFDSIAVGAQQGQYLVDKASGAGSPLYLYAGASSDNNAFVFFEGAWGVLQPKIADGTFVIKNSSEALTMKDKATLTRDEMSKIIGQITTNWDFNTAKNLAEANLTAAKPEDKGNVFILAPNDGTARAIADAFAADKDVKSFVVTGQYAEKASVQYIIDGKQSMTVFKDVRTLVKDAIGAAVALLKDETPAAKGAYNNGKVDVPAIQSAVVSVDKANVQAALIDAGYYTAADFTPAEEAAAPAEEAGPPAAALAGDPTLEGKLEIFSWWTAGGEAEGLNAMFEVYKKLFPNVEIVNATVAGGAGTNAKAVLATRLQGGNPPDSFQVHAGLEVQKYSPAEYLQSVDDMLGADVYPSDLLSMLKYEEHYWSIPVNIHRSNVLWYNKTIFKDAGVEVPMTMDEFFAACEALKAKGYVPVAMGTKEGWEAAHVFEGFLAAELGPDDYIGLWKGTTQWSDARVTKALENFKKMLTYVNTDHAALTWDGAGEYFITNKAAMMIMGDWTAGWFASKKYSDYGWSATPGSNGTFVALSDSFSLPKGSPNEPASKAWLAVAGSKEGQEAFNPKKGSICARTDCNNEAFKVVPETYEYLTAAAQDWQKARIVPSIVHGAATYESWATSFKDSVALFVSSGDVAKAQDSLAQLCVEAEICK